MEDEQQQQIEVDLQNKSKKTTSKKNGRRPQKKMEDDREKDELKINERRPQKK
jgi:hypothetical protein